MSRNLVTLLTLAILLLTGCFHRTPVLALAATTPTPSVLTEGTWEGVPVTWTGLCDPGQVHCPGEAELARLAIQQAACHIYTVGVADNSDLAIARASEMCNAVTAAAENAHITVNVSVLSSEVREEQGQRYQGIMILCE